MEHPLLSDGSAPPLLSPQISTESGQENVKDLDSPQGSDKNSDVSIAEEAKESPTSVEKPKLSEDWKFHKFQSRREANFQPIIASPDFQEDF